MYRIQWRRPGGARGVFAKTVRTWGVHCVKGVISGAIAFHRDGIGIIGRLRRDIMVVVAEATAAPSPPPPPSTLQGHSRKYSAAETIGRGGVDRMRRG
jgi:hypothetical protein